MRVAKCALVCRNWVPSSRRILFYKIHVTQDTAHGFAKLFYRHQRLTFLPFIREIEFRGSIVHHPWMKTVLPKIAKHLPTSIRSLILAGTWFYPSKPRLVSANLSGITRFELIGTWDLNLSDVLTCIASYPALEELKAWLPHRWFDTTMPDPLVRPAETLRSLDFKGCGAEPLWGWIQESRIVVSELRVYFPTLGPTPEFVPSIARYIESLGPSLTSLSLIFEVSDHKPVIDGPLSLKRNTGLRGLNIEAGPAQTLALLTRASLSPPLESVRVAITSSSLTSPIWQEIDRMVVRIPSVRRLELTHLRELAVSEIFPLCKARGVIEEVDGELVA
ncbi:hypothetical protein B0H12DRAFT_104856 [Mycena haematopus]|nr:hypothetical protein B0H12DRAFT_104856 [Mycena haematopus]